MLSTVFTVFLEMPSSTMHRRITRSFPGAAAGDVSGAPAISCSTIMEKAVYYRNILYLPTIYHLPFTIYSIQNIEYRIYKRWHW